MFLAPLLYLEGNGYNHGNNNARKTTTTFVAEFKSLRISYGTGTGTYIVCPI
jgi:hypothetical protein